MSLHLPARRLVRHAALAPLPYSPCTAIRPAPISFPHHGQQQQTRQISWPSWLKPKSKKSSAPLETALTRKQMEKQVVERASNVQAGDSIFDEGSPPSAGEASLESKDLATLPPDGHAPVKKPRKSKRGKDGHVPPSNLLSDTREHMARALDPDPRWRVRWQRRKVLQMVRGNNAMTRAQLIAASERECRHRSENFGTSTKKLMHLSRQVAGKTVDEALVQMRFSKKKAARYIVYALEEARDRAVVGHGMGLGKVNGEVLEGSRKIRTKDEDWIEVRDPSRLYVDQAWVGRSANRGYRIQHHGKSIMSAMWRHTSHITFLLKEEKTRLRLHDERVEKEAYRKPWVHNPNRPVTAQRPYYSW